ncbi:MAG TPA: hypothetical protein GXZ48_05105 [Acholeplasmataceae bacterium]|nr:hypothetical protein [Acholeplasmataceae bacterium]
MFRVKDLTYMAILTGILFIQEQILSFIPNVQLTVLLIVLYSKILGGPKTAIIVLIHTFLDTLLFNGLIYFPFMLAGWLIIPITLNTIFKRVENIYALAGLGFLYSITYSWMFVLANSLIGEVSFVHYLLSDIIFELILGISSFISILWLYEPLKKYHDNFVKL